MWIAIGGIFVFIAVCVYVGSSSKESVTSYSKSRFEKVNDVEGILHVKGREPIHTYKIGNLTLNNVLEIQFYQTGHRPVRITDMIYQGKSLFSYAPAGTDHREKCDFALATLKSMANQNGLSQKFVTEVEDIIYEVDQLKELMDEGSVYQKDNYEYAWR